MPLLIIDYVRENYTVEHGGILRKFFKQEMKYAEGQILEVYEGPLGREKTRVVNKRITCIFDHVKIYLPRDDVLKTGIVPRVWIVLSINRVGDPRRDVYYPVYPNRVNIYVPWKSRFYAKLEELFFKTTGLDRYFASIIYRTSELLNLLREYRSEMSVEKHK